MKKTVLVPSLGISLFNIEVMIYRSKKILFSSPLWGFLYLMIMRGTNSKEVKFSSPLWGFLYLISTVLLLDGNTASSRPLSGDFFI